MIVTPHLIFGPAQLHTTVAGQCDVQWTSSFGGLVTQIIWEDAMAKTVSTVSCCDNEASQITSFDNLFIIMIMNLNN